MKEHAFQIKFRNIRIQNLHFSKTFPFLTAEKLGFVPRAFCLLGDLAAVGGDEAYLRLASSLEVRALLRVIKI